MILNSRSKLSPYLLQVHKFYTYTLHLKIGHYPPVLYDQHGGALTSVTLHLGFLAIEVAIDIYLDVGSSSYHNCFISVAFINLCLVW